MPENLNVLFLAAEAEPFVKVGGLGDVGGALPRYLRNLSREVTHGTEVDVRLVLPMHPLLKASAHRLRPLLTFPLRHGPDAIQVDILVAGLDGMPVYFIDGKPMSSGGSVYSADPALDSDKYTFFSLAALELTRQLGWMPHILHANDWHSALACYALLMNRRRGEFPGVASILTVHNLPFMGPDISESLAPYGLPAVQTGLPRWARTKPLPLGLWAADAIVMVSRLYALEVLTPDFGCGLQDYLRGRQDSLSGILNGIDYDLYNPALDPALDSNFGIPTLEKRAVNKAALQSQLHLPAQADVPLLAVISRMDPQKGIDLIPAALRRIKDLKWQAVILGMGLPRLENAALRLQQEFPNQVRVEIKYDARLARRIYAGSDMLVMPSRYEPCGLSQMIAMRYGCVPVATAVGGLKDTVIDAQTGFLFSKPTAARLAAAIRRALGTFPDRTRWGALQKAAMSQNFSWTVSAGHYFDLYHKVVDHLASRGPH